MDKMLVKNIAAPSFPGVIMGQFCEPGNDTSTLVVRSSSFINNRAQVYGEGVINVCGGAGVKITSSSFTRNLCGGTANANDQPVSGILVLFAKKLEIDS